MSDISKITLPNGSTYNLKDASLHAQTGILSGDGMDVIGVSENYFRPTVKIFDAPPTRTDLSVIKISAEDYNGLVANDVLLSDALYVVEGSYEDVHGQQVKNMAPGTELSDAVNLEQLAEVSSRAYDTYTQSEVDQKIASAQYFKKYVVQTLPPVTDADERGIYLVPSSDPETQNTYDEYVVVGEGSSKAWEKIGAKSIDLSGYKTKQAAKTSPAASSTATSFIDTITQNENGEITATKKTVQSASTSQAGIVQLNNTLTSTSTTQAATANAVKLTNDKFADYSLTSHTHSGYLPTSGGEITDSLTVDNGLSVGGVINAGEYFVVDAGSGNLTASVPHIDDCYSNCYSFNGVDGQWAADSGNGIYLEVAQYADNPVKIKINRLSDLTEDDAFALTSDLTGFAQESDIPTEPTDIGAAAATHNHGQINSWGQLTTTVDIGNGDKIAIMDSSNSNALKVASITFDGSTTTQFLSKKGTWESAVPTSRTVAGYQLTANVTAANISSAIGLGSYALDISALHKTGDETASGKKTFSDAFTIGTRKSGSTVGTKSFAYGANNTASGEGSFAGGQNSIANAYGAHAEGYSVSATGYMSYAIGQGTLASGYTSYAEGYSTKATGGQTHAEGGGTVAAGANSHAENSQTSAVGNNSHAEGYETIAQNDNEHAQGAHNFSNAGNQLSSKTLDSVGIGDHTSRRKNATEVMQNGDAYFLGVGGYDGTNAASTTSKPLATIINAKADLSSLSYKLATATGTLSSGSYVYDVEDRSVTTIGINQSSTPVIVRLPNASGSGARDFILRIEISSSSAPSFTFTNTAGLDFDSEDDDWAVMEPGLNIVSFTETKR